MRRALAMAMGNVGCEPQREDAGNRECRGTRRPAGISPRRPFSAPLALWVPIASTAAIGVPGVISLLTHHLVLFASLAPTSVMITQQPLLASTRPYNTIVGHMVGLAAGFFAVWVLGIAAQPSVFDAHMVSGPRVCAALLALFLAMEAELLLRARHPPAASTTLLAALGSFRLGWTSTWEVLVGVIAVTATGEILRSFHPSPQPPDCRPFPASARFSALRRPGVRASADS
jgi:hypothetical protein